MQPMSFSQGDLNRVHPFFRGRFPGTGVLGGDGIRSDKCERFSYAHFGMYDFCVFYRENTPFTVCAPPKHTEYFFEPNARFSYVRDFGIWFESSYVLNKNKDCVREAIIT